MLVKHQEIIILHHQNKYSLRNKAHQNKIIEIFYVCCSQRVINVGTPHLTSTVQSPNSQQVKCAYCHQMFLVSTFFCFHFKCTDKQLYTPTNLKLFLKNAKLELFLKKFTETNKRTT